MVPPCAWAAMESKRPESHIIASDRPPHLRRWRDLVRPVERRMERHSPMVRRTWPARADRRAKVLTASSSLTRRRPIQGLAEAGLMVCPCRPACLSKFGEDECNRRVGCRMAGSTVLSRLDEGPACAAGRRRLAACGRPRYPFWPCPRPAVIDASVAATARLS